LTIFSGLSLRAATVVAAAAAAAAAATASSQHPEQLGRVSHASANACRFKWLPYHWEKVLSIKMSKHLVVCVTGAAGQISYRCPASSPHSFRPLLMAVFSLLPLIANGRTFGPDTEVTLHLLDLTVRFSSWPLAFRRQRFERADASCRSP
jgi:hypothetical protein